MPAVRKGLTVWLAYFILLIVPWLPGRSLASTTGG